MAYTSSTKLLFIGVLILSIFVMLTFSCAQYTPYLKQTNYAEFQEGMATIAPQLIAPSENNNSSLLPGFEGAWYSSPDSASSSIDTFMSDKANINC